MEEDKVIKRKKAFRLAYKIVSYTFIIILMIIAAFFIFYILCGKIAEKKGENPPFNLYTIISPSMTPNIKVYDVVFVRKTDTENLKENDVITFYSTNSYFGNTPITHRIVEVLEVPDRGKMYRVKGDANETADEEKVYPSNIIGKVMFKIPQLGKLQFFLTTKGGWLVAILIPALIIVGYDIFKLIKLIKLKNKLLKLSPNSN
jgi:signal peptidase